jgi:nitrile hydratase subunit beta
MNSIHDMGGMHGLGPLDPSDDEIVFHAAWEGRTMALARAMMAGKHFNLDEYRYAMERIDPARYLQFSYYERWLEGTLNLLMEKGVITQQEFDAQLSKLSKADS